MSWVAKAVPACHSKNDKLKEKDLVGIPWMTAFALRDDGWYLRMDNVWAKGVSGQKELTSILRTALRKAHLTPDQVHRVLSHLEPYVGNCMPEAVKDRPTKSHEYVFLLSKSSRYYCDMNEVAEESAPASAARYAYGFNKVDRSGKLEGGSSHSKGKGADGGMLTPTGRRNRRSVWLIPPVPYKGAHFATMPPELVETCIKAGTSPQGQCASCSKPWVATRVKGEPLVEQQRASGADAQGEYHGEGQKDYEAGLAQNPSDVKRRILDGMREQTVTWQPSCTCGAEALPQVVLDPFGGSGTVGAVAKRLGRSAVMIELNPTYIALIDERVQKASR